MRKFTIFQAYGAWIAEDAFGNTIWARSRDELMHLFGGSPC